MLHMVISTSLSFQIAVKLFSKSVCSLVEMFVRFFLLIMTYPVISTNKGDVCPQYFYWKIVHVAPLNPET